MATKKEIERELKIALSEIGDIKPWFDKEVDAWVFEHKAYPVGYSGESKEEVIKNYPKYLREFIKQRFNENLAPSVERKTKRNEIVIAMEGKPKRRLGTLKGKIKMAKDFDDPLLPEDLLSDCSEL